MLTNEGTADRTIRAIIGIVLIILPLATSIALFSSAALYWGAIIVGAILLITAVTGFCPIYRVLGIKTCREC